MITKDNYEVVIRDMRLETTYDDIAVGLFQEILYATTNKICRFYKEFKKRRSYGREWPDYWPRIHLALPGCELIDLHKYDEDWAGLTENLTWQGDLGYKVCKIELYSRHIFNDKEDADDAYGSWGLILAFVDSFDVAKEQIPSLVETITWKDISCNVFP